MGSVGSDFSDCLGNVGLKDAMLISEAFAHGGAAASVSAGRATGPLILLGLAVAFGLIYALRRIWRQRKAARDAVK